METVKQFIILCLLDQFFGYHHKCPNENAEKLDGVDYVIGALLPAHYHEINNTYKLNYDAIGWASSILYSINQINANNSLIPNITLGYVVRDTCGMQKMAGHIAVEMMLDTKYFVPKPLLQNCTEYELCCNSKLSQSLLVGVVGVQKSATSAIFSGGYMPHISYDVTSARLSNTELYRTLLRIVPPSRFQAHAIANISSHFNWTFVTVLASNNHYGRLGLDELKQAFSVNKIRFKEYSIMNASEKIFDHLKTFGNKSHVVILWCDNQTEAARIIQNTSDLGIQQITWIVTDAWSTSLYTRAFLRNVAGRIISLSFAQGKVIAFESAFSTGSEDILCNNRWFTDYLKDQLPGSSCNESLFLSYIFEPVKYQQIMSSVYAIANGLHKYLNCTENKCLRRDCGINYRELYKEILNVKFVLPNSTNHIQFDNNSEYFHPKYEYRMADLTNLSEKTLGDSFKYNSIGSWSKRTSINISKVNWGSAGQPRSFCANCQPGSYKIEDNSQRCWKCAKCGENNVSLIPNELSCKPCKATELASKNRTFCQTLRNDALKIKSPTGIFVGAFSAVGVTVSLFVIGTYIIFWDTPVIKSSSRELSIIQLTSLLVSFCLPILEYIPRTASLCALQTLIYGFSHSAVVAVIVVKAYRLVRIFKGNFSKVSRIFHTRYQIVFAFMIPFIQLIACVIWLLCKPTQTKIMINKALLLYHVTCGINNSNMLRLVKLYLLFLGLMCGYMAFRVRKLPENYNEAQFICFSMLTSCVLWLLHIPLESSLHGASTVVAFCSINNASTLAVLLILYGYKLYIVLLNPHMNSKEHFSKTRAKVVMTNYQRRTEPRDCESSTFMMRELSYEYD